MNDLLNVIFRWANGWFEIYAWIIVLRSKNSFMNLDNWPVVASYTHSTHIESHTQIVDTKQLENNVSHHS